MFNCHAFVHAVSYENRYSGELYALSARLVQPDSNNRYPYVRWRLRMPLSWWYSMMSVCTPVCCLRSVDEAGSEPPQQSLPSLASQRTLEGCSRTIGIKEVSGKHVTSIVTSARKRSYLKNYPVEWRPVLILC